MSISRKLAVSSVVAALGGFLFGFDTVVISGAEQTIQALWGLTEWQHGFVTSSALWGTVLGALVGGKPSDWFGRQKTLLSIGVLFFVSAVWSALAGDPYSFWIARFIGGLGVGVSTVASPLYISEISPPGYRGRLAGMFQFNIVFGILVAYLSNAVLRTDVVTVWVGEENVWRWMLGVEALPAAVYSLCCFGIPESPRWLIGHRGDMAGGERVLAAVNAGASEEEISRLAGAIREASQEDTAESGFWTMRHRVPIMLAILIAFFNQLSGINAVLYFAPRIFEETGLDASAAMLQSVGIGVTNLVFTFVGLWLIDRLGRKTLLVIGSIGYIGSLGLCSWAFFTGTFSIVPACIFAFIAAHAVGQGAVIWVFISEIFPNQHRASGQSLGSFTHWIFAALLTVFFPKMVTYFAPGAVFAFFGGMMVLQLVWVLMWVPETKGVPLEEIQRRLGIGG